MTEPFKPKRCCAVQTQDTPASKGLIHATCSASQARFFRWAGVAWVILGLLTISGSGQTSTGLLGEAESSESVLHRLKGVWELESLDEGDGKLEERSPSVFAMMRRILYISEDKAYLVAGSGSHAVAFKNQISFPSSKQSGEIDFLVERTGKTIRYLFALRGSRLILCQHHKGADGPRPVGLEPKRLEATVAVYRRLVDEEQLEPNRGAEEKKATFFEGLWDTVSYEFDGAKLEDDFDPFVFERKRKLLLFSGGRYLIIDARNSRLRLEHATYRLVGNSNVGIDLRYPGGSAVKAIYTCQGDRILFCWSKDTQARPTAVSSEDGGTVVRFRRVDNRK